MLRKSGTSKGFSNVIHLALVVVAIIVAFYVAQSMLGSVQEDPISVEYLEFVNLTTSRDAHMNWQVFVFVANPGNSSVILERVLVNSMEVSEYSA